MKKNTVCVIIPTYNRKNDVVRCIRSIKKSVGVSYRIFVSDDGSTDGTKEMVAKLFPEVKVIVSKKNRGAANARNLGMKAALKMPTDFLFFSDSDFILEPKTLLEMVNAIKDKPEYAAATGKIVFADRPDTVQVGANSVGLYTGLNYCETGPDNGQFDTPKDSLSGGALFIKKDHAKKVGFFDEIYPIPYEDADYSVRINKSGYKIIYVPTARIYHKTPYSDPKIAQKFWIRGAYRTARNKIIFMRKHSPAFWLFLLIYPIYPAFYTYVSLKHRNLTALKNYYWGIIAGFYEKIN